MVGGTPEHVATAQPIFDALKPADGGFVHAGPVGTGHFTKMVHNGIEYGLMQAYAEGYELLARSGLGIDVDGALDAGARARSYGRGCSTCWCAAAHPRLRGHLGYAKDSGEGRWTVQEAVERGVATPVISAALYARFVSQQEDSIAMKAIAALRNQFGGHAVLPETEAVDRAAGACRRRPVVVADVARPSGQRRWCCSAPPATSPARRSSRPSTRAQRSRAGMTIIGVRRPT